MERPRLRRLVAGLVIAATLATAPAVVIVVRAEADYNGNPTYCHAHDPTYVLWWWNECWLPDPPDYAVMPG